MSARRKWVGILFAVGVMAAQTVAQEGNDLRVFWKNGLRMESADKTVKLKFGGRIMNDWAFFEESDGIRARFGKQQDGTEFRRARLFFSGKINNRVSFKAQYDFGGGVAEFKDVFLALSVPVVGHVKVGRYKEPFSLEELTSSKYPTFMERGLPNALAPSRQTGFMVYDTAHDENMTWAVGVFRQTDDFGDGSGGSFNVTGRLTGLPWHEADDKLFHVGVAFSHREIGSAGTSYATDPEAHLASDFLDTGTLAADGLDLFGAELALVYGSLSVQAEYIHASVDMGAASDVDLSGYYVYASYFLTGEHRTYETDVAEFGRIKPIADFGDDGNGAWEVGLRLSRLDFTDGAVTGGDLGDVTAGLNWYLNPNTRVMFNYVYADLSGVGVMHTFETRFQIDF